MNIGASIAIYFVCWWTVLFAVLPFGIRSAHEAGAVVEQGHEPGAPVRTLLLKKFIATTLIAALVFAAVRYAFVHHFFFQS